LRQGDAVRGQADIRDARHAGELSHEVRQPAPEQRLAPGEPEFADAQRRDDAHEALDLLEREDLRARQPLHVLFGNAIRTAQVAAVGDGDAQVHDLAPEPVDEAHRGAASRPPARSCRGHGAPRGPLAVPAVAARFHTGSTS
jgi:hypothetical protein